MTVDDYLPVYSWGQLLFDKPGSESQLWDSLLEKVWAKINGNYEMIIGGNSFEAFNLIMGAPTIYYDRTWADVGYVEGDDSTYATAA